MRDSNDRNISHFKRSKVHMSTTLRVFAIFAFIGRIPGQIKSKYYEAKWYAHFSNIGILDLISPTHAYSMRSNLNRSNHMSSKILLKIDQVSISFFDFKPIRLMLKLYMLTFYNIAYIASMALSPSCAKDIFKSSEHKKLILMGDAISKSCHRINGLFKKTIK